VNDGRLALKFVRVETSNEIQYSRIGQLLFAQLFPSHRKRVFDATGGQPIKFALTRRMGMQRHYFGKANSFLVRAKAMSNDKIVGDLIDFSP